MDNETSVYALGQFAVEDLDRFKSEYVMPLHDVNARHEVEPIALAVGPEAIEGEEDPRLVVILKFASRAAFDAWYDDADYQPLLKLRGEITDLAKSSFSLLPSVTP